MNFLSLKKLKRSVFGANKQEKEQRKQARIEASLEEIEIYKARGDAGIAPLIALLKVDSIVVGNRASEALSDMGAAAIPALRNYVYGQIAEVRARKRKNAFRLILAIVIWLFITSIALALPQRAFAHHVLRILAQFSTSFLSVLLLKDVVSSRQNAISALRRFDDPRQIGLFAICMNDKNGDVRKVAKEELKRLLPRTQASDAQYINKDEMQVLVDALRKQKHNAGLMLSLLKGMEQIGDGRALANVAALTDDPTVSPPVKQAARDCLPYLRVRAEQTQQAQTLLRASSGAEIAPQTLLRPASGVAPNDERQLLRPKL